jgi:hypothetical protein
MGGKQKAPPAPDYTPLVAASTQNADTARYAADKAYDTSQQQLDWARQQYADQKPQTDAFMKSMIANSDQQTQQASDAEARYKSVYQPIEDKFASEATGWNSPTRSNQQAGAAEAEVATQFNQARNASQSALESYGIDPSQTRYAALDLGTRVQQAAAQATAGTQSRVQTEATGLALQGEAVNIGRGYPGQVAQSYAGATQAGTSGINAGLGTMSTGSNMMGNPASWFSGGSSALNSSTGALAGAGNMMNTGFQDNMAHTQYNNQQIAQNMQGIGRMIGGAISGGMSGGGSALLGML